MDRRDFLRTSLLTYGSLAVPGKLSGRRAIDTRSDSKFHIQYVREEIPAFEIPPYRGRSYEDNVPDTLDIGERARLGVHVLTSITDPEVDDEIYWSCHFFRNPPRLNTVSMIGFRTKKVRWKPCRFFGWRAAIT